MSSANESKPFKSQRAAKMAFTKAENAWRAKETEAGEARDAARLGIQEEPQMPWEEYQSLKAMQARCEDEAKVLCEHAQMVYDRARAQGFWIKSYRFGENATRDLVAANID